MEASLLVSAKNTLGEGPMWDEDRKSIWWADIEGKKIFEYQLRESILKEWQLQKRVSFINKIEASRNLLIALEDGIATFNVNDGSITYLQHLEKELTTNRTNDGACDCNGNIWLGTMDTNCKAGCGSLYYFDDKLQPSKKIRSTDISNGMAWSMDNKTFYHIDSTKYGVDTYLFDETKAHIEFIKSAIHIEQRMGMADGMCMDKDGMLWIAHWGGFAVYQWNPFTGKNLQKIYVPVPNVTSCCFGGDEMDILFITTASTSLTSEEIERYPESGSVFTARPGVQGVGKNRFRLKL